MTGSKNPYRDLVRFKGLNVMVDQLHGNLKGD